MNKVILAFLMGIVVWIGYNVYIDIVPCARTITYSIGAIDPRFNISEDQFKYAIREAEKKWEEERGSNLFEYNPSAPFKINLVYDERQERTDNAKKYSSSLTSQRDELDILRREHNELISRYKEGVLQYSKSPSEALRKEINAISQSANKKGTELNNLVKKYNDNVVLFNNEYGKEVEFNQGVYYGKGITIYQFSGSGDLVTVLAHEFGHALGMGHVNNPLALMHYKIEKTGKKVASLHEEDKIELNRVCKYTLK